jgi:hypothetical protein
MKRIGASCAPAIHRARKKNGPVPAGKGLSGAGAGKYDLPKRLRLSFPFCVSYRLQNTAAAARAARLMLIDPAHKEWRISHPFPQKTRKWMGHGRSILGPDQYRMSMRRKREMIGKWREKNLRSAFGPAAPLFPGPIA